MPRNKGTFDFAANFEVLAKAPLDARMRVETYEELVDSAIWDKTGSGSWLYDGAIVVVSTDPSAGVYWLKDADNYTDYASWISVGSEISLDASGTPSIMWQLNNDASGVILQDASGNLEILNVDGSLAIVSVGSLVIDNLTGPLYAEDGSVYVGTPTTLLTFDASIEGDDNTTTFAIVHNLSTLKQTIEIWDASTYETIYPAITKGSSTNYISFHTPPTAGEIYDINIIGFNE